MFGHLKEPPAWEQRATEVDHHSMFGIVTLSIRDRWTDTLTKSEKAQFKRNESILTQREHSYNRH
jgi:hypothetical protein